MLGLMQRHALTLDGICDHAARWHPDREVVSRLHDGSIVRTDYARIHDRAKDFGVDRPVLRVRKEAQRHGAGREDALEL